MCVCMHACMCVCTRVCTYICIGVYICIVCGYVCTVRMCLCACMYVCMCMIHFWWLIEALRQRVEKILISKWKAGPPPNVVILICFDIKIRFANLQPKTCDFNIKIFRFWQVKKLKCIALHVLIAHYASFCRRLLLLEANNQADAPLCAYVSSNIDVLFCQNHVNISKTLILISISKIADHHSLGSLSGGWKAPVPVRGSVPAG